MKPSKLSFLKVWKVACFYFVFPLTGLLSLSGCQNKPRPSFIIVALDRLSFNAYSCADEKSNSSSGLDTLCKEAIRFTHAYTTSVQPAAALGSLLTGNYPYVHGLHRGSGRMKSQAIRASVIADQQGYRTSFFSGSPAVMKKTGLAKGFDFFDDLSFLDQKNYLGQFKKQSDSFITWADESREPFFSIIYNSELESLNEAETDISTFEKLDENLATFFGELKQNDLWNSNYVIVIGLQGQSDYSRYDESLMSNLHSENTNISLFVKPPRQKGDDGINRKVDTFVNTADLGWALIKTLNDSITKPTDDHFPIVDLSILWKTPEGKSLPDLDRKLLIETINPWAVDLESRYAVLFKNFVYIENNHDHIFNSLNDGLETIDLSNSLTSLSTDFKNDNRRILSSIRGSLKQNQWLDFKTDIDGWVSANREYWLDPISRPTILADEWARFNATRISQPLTTLMIQNYVVNNKVEALRQLGFKIESAKTTEKDANLDEARRQSMNLSLENLWGIWGKNKNWAQSPLIKEYQ